MGGGGVGRGIVQHGKLVDVLCLYKCCGLMLEFV